MEDGRLRILLVGDASNCHNALAVGLRKLGHDVTVASDGTNWMSTPRDIDIRRRWSGKMGGLELWLRTLALRNKLTGFDIVSIAGQGFISLRPVRQRVIYDFLRRNNKSIFYTALATDSNYVKWALSAECPLDYTEYKYHGADTPYLTRQRDLADEWLGDPLGGFCDHIYDTVDGAVSVLYEYDLAVRRSLSGDKVAYGGIPINLNDIGPSMMPDRIEKVRIFLGRHRGRDLEKGWEILEDAAKEVVSRHPRSCELVVVENRPYAEYVSLLSSAHLLLDQLYSYTPATSALLAMAHGLATISGGEEAYYEFIGERELRPIVNGLPDRDMLVRAIGHLVENPSEIVARGRMGRDFVRKHNSDTVVAKRFVDLWHKNSKKL